MLKNLNAAPSSDQPSLESVSALNFEPGSREEKNALSFFDFLATSGGGTLRPINRKTVQDMQLLELAMARGTKEWRQLSPDRMQDELDVFFFIHVADLQIVSRAIRKFRSDLQTHPRAEAFEDLMIHYVEPFLRSLTIDQRETLKEQLDSLDRLAAAQVTAAAPTGQKQERPDPN